MAFERERAIPAATGALAERVPAGAAALSAPPAPRPTLRLADAMALIVGTVVGAGIFRTPSLVAANAGSEGAALAAWTLGGLLSLIGALCYAELAATYPNAGGDYHFLRRAYGEKVAFLFGWARLTVIQTGSIALLAFIVGDYAAALWSFGPYSSALYAALAVVVLTALNVAGIRHGSRVQKALTAAEVLGLLLVVAAGLALGTGASAPATAVAGQGASAFGLSMVFVLLTYGGWNEGAYISAEVEQPARNIVRALVWSVLAVTSLYLLVNWAYLRGLGVQGVAGSSAVAADLVGRVTGGAGAGLVSLLIAVSALTSVNATIVTGARTAYALGRDFPLFGGLGRWNRKADTPVNALVVQGAIALTLALLGGMTRKGFETTVEYTAPVFWLFFLLTGLALFILRRSDAAPRRFEVPLYPITPLLFCATSAYLLYASLAYTGVGALVGVGVLATGGLVLALLSPHDATGRLP
jgi:amino acid transporter